METKRKRLSKGARRHHKDTASVAYSDTVQVRFRLYDKLASDGVGGAFKQPPSQKKRPKFEPFWLCLFQDAGDQVHLSHEAFVDEDGVYHHPPKDDSVTDSAQEPPSPDALSLPRAYRRNNTVWYYKYYVLISPFRFPRSRLDPILPRGKTKRGDERAREQFISWAKHRELSEVSFTPGQVAPGAICDLWAPWLKAQAMADQYDAALREYAKEHLDQIDKIELANLIARWSRLYRLDDYVSTDNIQHLFKELPRIITLLQQASTTVTEYTATNAFAEMILDMWEDKSGNAFLTLAPFLANIYRAVDLAQLRDMANKPYFDVDLAWSNFDTLKAARRLMKPIWEIHACFAKALEHKATNPDARLDWYVQTAKSYSKKLFNTELHWDKQRRAWNLHQVTQLKRGGGYAALFNFFLGCLDIYNSYSSIVAFHKDRESPRARTALASAYVSQFTNFLRLVDLTLPDTAESELKKIMVRLRGGNVISTMQYPAPTPEEIVVLRRINRREAILRGLRNKALTRGLSALGGAFDALTAYFDLRTAVKTANTNAAIWNSMALLGGLCVAAAAVFTGQVFWLAFAGQSLLLVGSVGSSLSQDTALELWMKFSKFGILSASTDSDAPAPWAQGLTLGAFARTSARSQIEAYKKIVYQAEVSARRICNERVNDLFEFSVTFPYGVPKTTSIFCRVELLREDGSVHLARPFSPLEAGVDTVVFRYAEFSKDTVMGLLVLFDEAKVLFATEAINIAIWMDITGACDFYPVNGIVRTYPVDKLPHT